mmetsp:Transcript_38916/g.93051  ORF Transcript_38916/g.93051 Transcript_38916/m.93051 type:complete len:220 (+) Transcript_38916:188-847(+)
MVVPRSPFRKPVQHQVRGRGDLLQARHCHQLHLRSRQSLTPLPSGHLHLEAGLDLLGLGVDTKLRREELGPVERQAEQGQGDIPGPKVPGGHGQNLGQPHHLLLHAGDDVLVGILGEDVEPRPVQSKPLLHEGQVERPIEVKEDVLLMILEGPLCHVGSHPVAQRLHVLLQLYEIGHPAVVVMTARGAIMLPRQSENCDALGWQHADDHVRADPFLTDP